MFEDQNRKISPFPLPIAGCLSLFLHLTWHFPLVPSPVMGFPMAMCFHTGSSIVSHRGYYFPSWQSDCHVVCQVLEYIIFSKAAVLHSVLRCHFSPVPAPWLLFFTASPSSLHSQVLPHHPPFLVSLLAWHCFAAFWGKVVQSLLVLLHWAVFKEKGLKRHLPLSCRLGSLKRSFLLRCCKIGHVQRSSLSSLMLKKCFPARGHF